MEISHEHMIALMKPKGVIIVGATDRENSVGKGILNNIICAQWPDFDDDHLISSSKAAADSSSSSAEGGSNTANQRDTSPPPTLKRGRKNCSDDGEGGLSKDYPNLPYRVYPVNPKRSEILGFRCYARAEDIESKTSADLAVICVPAKSCLEAVRSCGELGSVKALIIIAAGFKEIGREGEELELACIEMAKKYGMGVTGPNCLGVQSPNFHLNASFSASNAMPGHIAFISQSGAICTAILDWSLGKSASQAEASCGPTIGFSAFVSLGSMAHVEWSEWISYCQADEETDAIVMYMETVGNASKFIRAAQQCSKHKPIVIIKAGKSDEAAAAAASHTGSLTGTYNNFLAAMDRAGCLVLDSIDDLQNIIELLSSISKRKRQLRSERNIITAHLSDDVIVVTNAGGPGVLCTDAISEAGLKMINPINQKCLEKLNQILPPAWSHNNPIDLLGDADHLRYKHTIQTITDCLQEEVGPTTPEAGAMTPTALPRGAMTPTALPHPAPSILVILTPQSVTKPTETALVIREIVADQKEGDPFIICSWMGGPAIEEGKRILERANIPVFHQPDVAARALGLLRKQQRLAAKIISRDDGEVGLKIQQREAREFISQLRTKHEAAAGSAGAASSITLSEHDSKSVLKFYNLKITDSVICNDLRDLSSRVEEVGGYPVVLKIHGGRYSHKSDIGGVMLNIKNDGEAVKAYNMIKENYERLDPSGFEGVTVQPMIQASTFNGKRPDLIKAKNSPELILGCVQDPQFGPMIMFGTGGTFVEVFNDTAITLCPIQTRDQAKELLVRKTAISKALMTEEDYESGGGSGSGSGHSRHSSGSAGHMSQGSSGGGGYHDHRGGRAAVKDGSQRFPYINEDNLYDTIIQFSQLCIDLKDDLLECEMNPLIITKDNNLLALDARIILKTK